MAGQPFDLELLRNLWTCAVFCPVITLGALERLSDPAIDWATQTDYNVIEAVLALHLMQASQLRGILPLLVGEEVDPPNCTPGDTAKRCWDFLPDNPRFKELKSALPNAVPSACLDAALVLLRSDSPESCFSPALAKATVREIMTAGNGAAESEQPLRGLLRHDWHTLEGRQQALRDAAGVFASKVRGVCERSEREGLGGWEEKAEKAELCVPLLCEP
jgi:hypothetical protein